MIVGLLHIFARPALDKPIEAIVQALVVDENVRGKGVGRALMRAAEPWARRRGLRSIALHSAGQRGAANAFYKRIGFVQVGSAKFMRKTVDKD